MTSAILIFTVALFAVGACLIAIIHRLRSIEANRPMNDWLKYGVYVAFVYIILLAGMYDRECLSALLMVVVAGGSIEFYRNLTNDKYRWLAATAMPVGMILCFGHLVTSASQPWYRDFVFVFLLVAITDSFSQLWGRLLGRHRLCPSISPGKTVEGFIGGTATAIVAAISLQFLKPDISAWSVALIGLIVAASATSGDLLFSAIKRQLKIKDFSGLLPGHGGLLDRFDSLLIAAPVYYWTNQMLMN